MRRFHGATSAALLLTASTLALAAAGPAMAQTWTGATDVDWYKASNWSTNAVPTGATTATIKGPVVNTPTIDGGVAAANILWVGYETSLGGITLALKNGAQLSTSNSIIGENTNVAGLHPERQSGRVSLIEASNWNAGSLTIGSYGDGVIDIAGGSTVTASSLSMGNLGPTIPEASSGVLNISGSGSKLTVTSTSTSIGSSGAGAILVENRGKLVTSSAGMGVHASGTGAVTITGAESDWTVTGNGTVNVGGQGAGTLKIQNGATFSSGAGKINVANSGASGTGSLLVEGAGSKMTAGQVWIGAGDGNATVRAGAEAALTHVLLGTSAAGSGSLVVADTDTLVTASTYLMAGYLGVGTVTISDGATVRTPDTRIAFAAGSQGTVNIGATASSAAAAAGQLDSAKIVFGAGTGTLVLNHTSTGYTLGSNLTGAGTISHLAGTTNLTGASTGFTGNTTVNGGTLNILGALGGNVTVKSGATLGGNGTVGNVQLNAGSTIDPNGTLTASGNLNFAAGSTYRADVGNGLGDQITTATGTVTIAGGAVNLQTAGKSFGREEAYKILGGAVLTGTFDSLSTQSAFLDALLDYSKTGEVWVNLSRNDVKFQQFAVSNNQQAIANLLNALPLNHPLVAAMLGLSAEEAKNAMNQLSGDTQATLETAGASIAGQVQNVLMNRIRQAFSAINAQRSNISSYAPRLGEVDAGESPEISYWLQGLGEYAHVDATATAGGLRSGTAGVLGGADVALAEWRLGVVGGYTGTGYTAEGRPASGNIHNIHAGLYAGAEFDALRLQFNALQTWHGISSRRDVSFGGLNETLTADYGAQTSLLFGEIGYGFDLGAAEIEPFASVAYSLGQTAAYSESGGASALSVAASSQQSITTVLGLRPEMAFALDDKLLTLRGMVGWQHQAGEVPTGQYSLAGSAPFTVTGSSLASDAFVYEAGLNLDVNEALNFDLLYSGRLAQHDFAQGIKGIVAAKF